MSRQTKILRAIYDEEPGNRRRLWALRESPEYGRPFEEPNPLVTIFITTYSNAEGLAERSISSVLAQTYDNVEVLVIGDAASPEVEAAVLGAVCAERVSPVEGITVAPGVSPVNAAILSAMTAAR